MDILNPQFCNSTVPTFLKVRPEVICVAHNRTYNTLIYQYEEPNRYKRIDLDSRQAAQLLRRDKHWFISGTGTLLYHLIVQKSDCKLAFFAQVLAKVTAEVRYSKCMKI